MHGPSMVNTTYQSTIVSVYNARQALGGLATGYVADKFSRKYIILIASILTIIGAALQCAAVNMIAGRLVVAIGCVQILPSYLPRRSLEARSTKLPS
ncbi:high-affinity glucose transporter [Fusarium pseudoanthophilum]|uniref:High-affinity glucose transporter n=1 Tax=Fusarium pseudoanthophilum TaxID=48495 RepID=A0A8H5KDY8_9HYPO|nr:high-affinity glucose transporter [Fusarium pseudoanthophilum]